MNKGRERGCSRTPQLLSVVIPCCDEEAVIRETHRRLTIVLCEIPDLDYEPSTSTTEAATPRWTSCAHSSPAMRVCG